MKNKTYTLMGILLAILLSGVLTPGFCEDNGEIEKESKAAVSEIKEGAVKAGKEIKEGTVQTGAALKKEAKEVGQGFKNAFLKTKEAITKKIVGDKK